MRQSMRLPIILALRGHRGVRCMPKGLSCTSLSSGYDRRAGTKISGVSLSFGQGRFTALIGPNGCGKTTLLKALIGFLPCWEGDVALDAEPIRSIPRKRLARRVAYLPQETHCPDYLTVGELMEMGTHAQAPVFAMRPSLSRRRAEAILADVGLQGLGAAQVNRLSGGQRQRAFLAMILAQDADILLLDEPVNHLDLRHQYGILSLVRQLVTRRGRTVIAVLHDLNLTGAFADEVALMQSGRVIAHAPVPEVLTAARIEEVFGLRGEVRQHKGRLSFLPDIDTEPGPTLRAVK